MSRTVTFALTAMLVVSLSASRTLADPEGDYEMLFGEEAGKVAATTSAKDDAELAAKVLTAAKMATDAPKAQVYFYQKAYELGIKDVSGRAIAVEALNLLEKAVPERRLEWQAKRLSLLEAAYQKARGADRKPAAEAYLGMLLSVAESADAAGKSKEAWDLYRKAHPVAMYVRSPHVAEIVKKIKEMNEVAVAVKRRQEKLKSLMNKLAADPRDMEARAELILFCVAELDEPHKAASLLTKGVDEKLAALVTLATKKAEDVPLESCLELGNWYYETLPGKASAPSKAALLRRAAAYYQRFLALYTKRDATRLNASLVLAEINKELAKLGSAAPSADPVAKLKKMGAVLVMTFDKGTVLKRNEQTWVKDLSGKDNHGRVSGATTVAGKKGNALLFDGNDYVQVKHSPTLELSGTSWTISFWMLPKKYGVSLGTGLIDKNRDRNTGVAIWLYGKNIRLWHEANKDKDFSTAVTLNEWIHVAVSFNKLKGGLAFYINGKLDKTYTIRGLAPSASNALEFGRFRGSTSYFSGMLDEVCVFRRALTALEIKELSR